MEGNELRREQDYGILATGLLIADTSEQHLVAVPWVERIMTQPTPFDSFLNSFFDLFIRRTFRGADYLTYLNRAPSGRRSRGNEASVVDTAIVGPLLGLLGFAPAERVYNQNQEDGRPDFAPGDETYGTCFVVEDKQTDLELDLNREDPDSHLSQLAAYARAAGVCLGWLTNGRRFMAWRFDDISNPRPIIDLDLPAAIHEWTSNVPPALSQTTEKALHDLFDLFCKDSFTDPQRLERELAISLEEWQQIALPLGTGQGNEALLVETVQGLVKELQRDARRTLDRHLARYAEYDQKASRLADEAPERAIEQLDTLRTKVTEVLEIINDARQRKYASNSRARATRRWANLDELPVFRDALQSYSEKAFASHQRQATLRQTYRQDLSVHDDYTVWSALVQETMLGGLNEDQRRDEFALQAAYVVFIRLFLIRVCEDKGIFPHRFVSDGGLQHWQEDIQRYLVFANGNPYSPLLDMAYSNAQNIYAHFFTGRDLFNWYELDQSRLIMAFYQLSRFNFAGVDSDIVGAIYNTYVSRKEKREKGQYYTPPAIVNYILDEIGYKSGPGIIGPNKRLIDPACGSGTFLVSAAKRLVAAYQGTREQVDDPEAVLARVQNSLFGFDLNPFACYLAEVNLLVQMLDLVKQAHDAGKRPSLQRFHIYNVDALARPTGMYYYAHFDTLLAEENDQVEQIKRRAYGTSYANGFAFVVANPPYGAELSDDYKEMLRSDWADVFYGQPDTYVFFLKFGIELLARGGKLGFITPNTYLMGVNTANLRGKLLEVGCVEQFVDLPQGIWLDANVDCVLIFLTQEGDEQQRRAQQAQINLLGLHDTLDKLTARSWNEELTQPQKRWIDDARHEMDIRHSPLLEQIEEACLISTNGSMKRKVLRLDDVTDSIQGIIPYKTRVEGEANRYIKPQNEISPNENAWKPLLDNTGFVGRYELRLGSTQPYLKYGDWLWREREPKYFEAPKLLVQDMRNRALRRRLVATFDDKKVYNRHNFNNIIAKNKSYDLKYILALFNSSILNYWFARRFDNVHINPSYFRQLPIKPADSTTQTAIAELVDQLLTKHTELNVLRQQGYTIKRRCDGSRTIEVSYDRLLTDIQRTDPSFPVLSFFDARAAGLFSIPDKCDLQASIGSNVHTPTRYPTTVVLRHNRLWLDIADDGLRRYMLNYLRQPQWQGKTWDELKNRAIVPADASALAQLFAREAQQIDSIQDILNDIERLDEQIDEQVLDLYGITDPGDRRRILGNAPRVVEEDESSAEDEQITGVDSDSSEGDG